MRRNQLPIGSSTVRVVSRREVLRYGVGVFSALTAGGFVVGCGDDDSFTTVGSGPMRVSNIANLGALRDPDANGVRLPEGFSSRVVAQARQEPIAGSGFRWHSSPDGGATFATNDGGWIYVSNSEVPLTGGVGALRFDADGTVVDAYPILSGTSINCAGGPTPWGTWLSCEEFETGQVWECDPFGVKPAVVRPALGAFYHEAVTVDPVHRHLLLTEDREDGGFYRFTADRLTGEGHPDLTSGKLEVAEVLGGGDEGEVRWHTVPDPSGATVRPRYQVAQRTAFDGGEGIWYHQGIVYFSTKGDNRIWAYDTNTQRLTVLYDDNSFETPVLRGVDNVTASFAGDVLVAEDGDDMQIVAITPDRKIVPVVQVVGHRAPSEITGPAFDPAGRRLYFSSQRGPTGFLSGGITYEVTGPFFREV